MAAAEYLTVPHLTRRQLARIFSKIQINKVTGCWNWTGTLVKGYGQCVINRRKYATHRLMYAWLVERLPKGVGPTIPVIDHLHCNNPKCCNVMHLQLTMPRVNVLRGCGFSALNARKTKCAKGHPLPADWNRKRGRECPTCRAAYERSERRKRYQLDYQAKWRETHRESSRAATRRYQAKQRSKRQAHKDS